MLDIESGAEVAAGDGSAEAEAKTGRGRGKAKVELSKEQAAHVLAIYPEDVTSVEATDAGPVVTTRDGHRYLLTASERQAPPQEGYAWLTKPAAKTDLLSAG